MSSKEEVCRSYARCCNAQGETLANSSVNKGKRLLNLLVQETKPMAPKATKKVSTTCSNFSSLLFSLFFLPFFFPLFFLDSFLYIYSRSTVATLKIDFFFFFLFLF